MFSESTALTTLDLSSFNTENVTSISYMFYKCNNLTTIYGTDWDTEAVTDGGYMFYCCYKLIGGQGTTYDWDHIGPGYAHIDGGSDNPGYFTEKAGSLRGDMNGDGNVDISDVTALTDQLLGGGTISNPAADCNQDGDVDIADVTALIDYLLSDYW